MFCTKCGSENEDNNVFCKNCGAKLVKPAVNSPVPSSSGVAQAAKAVNVKLIAGLAVALVVVAVAVVGLTNKNKAKDVNDDAKATAVMEHEETILTTVVTIDESNDAIGDIEESSKKLYSVTAEKISNDIASFQHFIVNGMYSISDRFSFDTDIKLEDVLVMTSTNRSNVSFVDIYSSSPDVIVTDSADIKDVDDFVTFCADPYRDIQWDIRKGSRSVSECYYDVVVEDSNIDGEYKYYDGEAEKVYIKIRFLNEKFVNRSYVFEMIQSSSNPLQWLINDCWESDDDNLSAYKLHNAGDPEGVSYPDWFNAYKEFAGEYKVAFVGADNNGIPYMVRESDGLYLYNGTSVDKVEIKGVEFDPSMTSDDAGIKYSGYNDMDYNPVTNQLELQINKSEYGDWGEAAYLDQWRYEITVSYHCFINLTTNETVYHVWHKGEEWCYFDGNGNPIEEDIYYREDMLFNRNKPNEDWQDPVTGYNMREYIENVYSGKSSALKSVYYYPVDKAFVRYLSECRLKPLTDSAETIVASPENVIDDSEWREAYKRAYARDNDGNQYCFIGQSNTGVPYLAKAWGGLDYYNGSEVVSLCYSQNIEYNPVTNKVSEFSHTSLPNGGGDNFYLIDLNIGEVELLCREVTEDWDTGIVKYYGDNGEISEEEYIRISDEMSKRFGDGGNIIETWYDSVELAYRAYNIKRGSTSALASASATNASESADTAIGDNTSASEYVLKDSSSRYLTKDDLQGLSADDCRIARNEIYARYGRKFDDEGLQSHFNSCSWYQGTIEPGDFQETMLSDIEVANKNLIVEYEKEMGYR